MERMTYTCPACGFAGLTDQPWSGQSPSDDICPSCGIQFGYHDARGTDALQRMRIYREWRERWIEAGMNWHAARIQPPPSNWNPADQVAKLIASDHLADTGKAAELS